MFYKIVLFILSFFIVSNASVDINNLNTFQSDFNQSIESTNGKIIEYKGFVFIRKDGKILWKYKTPIEKNVYVLNDFAIIDEPELEQAIYTTLQSEINIIKLLQTAKKIDNKSFIANYENVDYFITTNNEKNIIEQIEYKDRLENSVTIKFSNILINENIEDKLFIFTAPDYYDIIKK